MDEVASFESLASANEGLEVCLEELSPGDGAYSSFDSPRLSERSEVCCEESLGEKKKNRF